jgi:two-component system response regulator DevR
VATPSITVLLVDDHAVVRLGLRTLFGAVPRLTVVGEAGSVAEAIAEARRCQPDLVLMDVRLADGSGVEACREIRSERPQTRVLMLTSYDDKDAVMASILAGAGGYLLKQAKPQQLIEAVELVARGGSLLDPAVTGTVLDALQRLQAPPGEEPLAALSGQERRILPLIAEGKTNREIAAVLSLSEHTVKTYVSDLFRKLRLSRRAEAAAFVARLGSFSSPEPKSRPPA